MNFQIPCGAELRITPLLYNVKDVLKMNLLYEDPKWREELWVFVFESEMLNPDFGERWRLNAC